MANAVDMFSCFPSFALFVSCCPHPDLFTPQETGCPEELLPLVERCCKKRVSDAIFRRFGTISPTDLANAGYGTVDTLEYNKLLHVLVHHLERFVRDVNVLDREAWYTHAVATVKRALSRADVIKDEYVSAPWRTREEIDALLRQAKDISRMLSKALFTVDNFQQYLLSHAAMEGQKMIYGSNVENIRTSFGELAGCYESAALAHDLMVYEMIPALQTQLLEPLAVRPEDPLITIQVVSLGNFAKTGFVTIWSMLQHRSTCLNIFVIGDPLGTQAWKSAVQELLAVGETEFLRCVEFEYVDYTTHPGFQEYVRQYPKGCSFGEAGLAILARAVCHTWLPSSVNRVISIDLGDIVVLEDIRGLWDIGDEFEEHHLLAAAHAVALNHINGGLVVYNVQRMRERNFTQLSLQVVRDGLLRHDDGVCIRDQSIINILHENREQYGYGDLDPVMALPCRWSIFPTTEWQPHWNVPEMWLPEIQRYRRYPGFVSRGDVELYCPSTTDMLSNWAFIPISDKRQERVRLYAHHEGTRTKRHCSDLRRGEKCCMCGEGAALMHVPGDLKKWQSVKNFLLSYMPPWRERPQGDAFSQQSSRTWWGGNERAEKLLSETKGEALVTAKRLGLNAVFDRCHTANTEQRDGPNKLTYFALQVRVQIPLVLDIETTADRDAHVLIGPGGNTGFQLMMGLDEGRSTVLRWVRSAEGWATTGDIHTVMYAAQMRMHREGENLWARWRIQISEDGLYQVEHEGVSWGVPLPEDLFVILKRHPMTVSVGAFGIRARWAVCTADA